MGFDLGKRKREPPNPKISYNIPPPPWIELPGDLTANILKRLGAKEILERAQLVCSTWRNVCLDPAMWRVVELVAPDSYFETAQDYDLICRCVVDRSQGQLTDLRIVYFGDNSLLHYIADRSSHLQRLTIASSYVISGTALSVAVKKLPHLEELHLIMFKSIRAIDVEAIGISCPMLKSFSYHWYGKPMYAGISEPPEPEICNEYALAIAKTMPKLLHLQLLANWMKNDGLEAILDGCPLLESLDIRRCPCLDLKGALGRRCAQQIKNLRDPSDPNRVSHFEWAGIVDKSYDGKWCSYSSRCSNCYVKDFELGTGIDGE